MNFDFDSCLFKMSKNIWDTWIWLVFSVSIFDEHWYNFVVKIIITSNKTYTKITLARTKCCFKKNVEIDLIWTFIQLSDNWNQNVWKEFLKEFIQKTNELQWNIFCEMEIACSCGKIPNFFDFLHFLSLSI